MEALAPLRIGTLRTANNLVLAPMSGVTDSAFRSLVRACSGSAVGLMVSEFIAAEGLTRDNERTLRMLRYRESERPLSIQIFGADVERMARAARMVADAGADVVDINCGCPAPKVVRRGGGAELMRQGERLREILRRIVAVVGIPVTVKMRAGWDDSSVNAVEVARIAEGEGAAMLAVHGRTRVQLYSGAANWDLVRRVRGSVGIPVLGSGDIIDARGALARLRAGFADGVMVGRAAMDNPWIFREIDAVARGEQLPQASPQARLAALRLLGRLLGADLPEYAYVGRFRGMACRLVRGMPGSARARQLLGSVRSVAEVEAIFASFVVGGSEEPALAAAGC
jgi:nifR3 family TIM-barrel protein